MKIFFATDHRGFLLAMKLYSWMESQGLPVVRISPEELVPQDDYTDYAKRVALEISTDQEARGILFCGSGVGMDIAANRKKGVRSGLGISEDQVRAARADDDINILTIAADYTNFELAKKMIEIFLQTPFKNEEKYTRRIEKIEM